MQDIHSIGGGGARFFGGGGGVDRRLRPSLHHHQNNQSLKCPRCDSANTKFCYYNNYNLSQPRHFCKACRRYWTKGGVLRNVPVGGGCRKSAKRGGSSKPKQPSSSKNKSANSHSSSESSSLTASTTAAKPPPPSTASPSASTPATLLNFPDSRFFNFPVDHSTDGGVLTEIGSFTSMMTSSANDRSFLGFSMGDISGTPYRLHQDNEATAVRDGRPEQHHQWGQQQLQKVEELSAGFLDRTAQIDLSGMESRGNNGGAGTVLDWQGGGGESDQAIFDLPGTVDQAYWSQTQWPDNDPSSLYLP